MSTLVPRRFGPSTRRAIGLIQHPAPDTAPAGALLLARPMGLAATRSASMYRVLADRLSRSGATVMRFDYHGTGDSPGEEADQSLEDWTRDILEAHACLLDAAPFPDVDWFGMGLGANLMLQAAVRSARPPRRLLLWEPIADGPAHLEALLQAHRQELAMQLARDWPTLVAQGMATEPRLPGSVLGFDVGAQLLNDLQNLADLVNWLPLAVGLGIEVTLCAPADQLSRWTSAVPLATAEQLRLLPLESRTNWLSSEAMGAAVVPPELNRILEALTR